MKTETLTYLSATDVHECGLSLTDSLDIIEKVFREHGEGQFENPPKPGIYPREDAFIHAMPGYLNRRRIAGMKWISVFSGNVQRNLPSATGIIVLNDMDTGFPIAIMDASVITALRTAAASGVAARYLADKNAKTLGIVGTGVQGRYNVEVLKAIVPTIVDVNAFDVHPQSIDTFANFVQEKAGLSVKKCTTAETAIRDADIVVTATGVLHEAIFKASWIKKGALVLPVHAKGWEKSALDNADKFIVDDWNQFSSSLGKPGGFYFPLPPLYTELGQVVLGRKPGRESSEETIVSINYGMAIHDIAMAAETLKRATTMGLGTVLPL